jgi:moderate conductance mechanosensitive channel
MHKWIPTLLLRALGILAIVLSAAGILAISGDDAWGQETEQATEQASDRAVSVEDLRQLSAALEDDARRAELLANLRALIELREAALVKEELRAGTLLAGFIGELSESVAEIQDAVAALGGRLERLPAQAASALEQVLDPETRARWLTAVAVAAAVVIAAVTAELLIKIALRRPRMAVESREAAGLPLRLFLLMVRTIIDLVPIAALAILVTAVLSIVDVERQTRVVVLTIVNAYVFVRGIQVLARALFAPAAPSLRFLPISSETASYLNLWVRRLTLVGVIGYVVISGGLLLGMAPMVHALLLRVLGLVVALMAIIFILQNRAEVAAWIRTKSKGRAGEVVRRRLAAVWHVFAIIYVAAVYLIWAADIGNGFAFVARASVLTAIVVAAAVFVQSALAPIIRRGFGLSRELQAKYPDLERRANRYLPILSVAVRCVLWIVAVLAVLTAWGIDAFAWWATPAGGRLLNTILSIVIVLAGAAFVWETASAAIENYLARRTEEGKASARARTLLPLLRNALLVVLSVMVVLIVLSEIGVDIGPLLAGAGVVGLAIGFGSQTMVKDVITGAFLLFEDAISVGDVVSVAGTSGLVEGLSVRSIRLRDVSGNVHTIPFSSVDAVTNMTKEFSFYAMDIGVAYREDTDHVTEVIKDIIEEMRCEPEFEALILEPLEVLGVDRFADSAVIIKARIKTLPIKQWMVGREFNRRMKKRFDALGIEIPFPHQTLYFGVDKNGAAPPAHIRLDGSLEPKPEPTKDEACPPRAPQLPAVRSQAAVVGSEGAERR